MVKTSLAMEQIIAGALLLGFDRFYSADITLLAEDFVKKNPSYELKDLDWKCIYRYIKSKNGEITLKDGLTMESYIPEESSNLRKILEQIAGARIRKYINALDIEEFVLRKINKHIELSESDIQRLYCDKQQEILKILDEKGYLTRYWEDDCIYDDYRITKL